MELSYSIRTVTILQPLKPGYRLSCWNNGSTSLFSSPFTVTGALLRGGRSPPKPSFCKPASPSGKWEEGQQAQASTLSGNQWSYEKSKLESWLKGNPPVIHRPCWPLPGKGGRRVPPRRQGTDALAGACLTSAFSRVPAELRVSSTSGEAKACAPLAWPGTRKKGRLPWKKERKKKMERQSWWFKTYCKQRD